MKFEKAFAYLRKGKKINRSCWLHSYYLKVDHGEILFFREAVDYHGNIYVSSLREMASYISEGALLADDWQVLPDDWHPSFEKNYPLIK